VKALSKLKTCSKFFSKYIKEGGIFMRKIRRIKLLTVLLQCLSIVLESTALAIVINGVITVGWTLIMPSSSPSISTYLRMNLIISGIGVLCTILGYHCMAKKEKLEATLEELPERLPEDEGAIVTYHGNTLLEVMEALRDERLEYNVASDLDGRIIAEGTLLSPNECCLAKSDWGRLPDEYISLHNHPSLIEGAFSSDDIKNLMHDRRRVATIVVTTHFTYTLKWVDSTRKYEIDDVEFCKYVDRTLNLGKCSSVAFLVRWRRNYQIRKIARRYGLVYTIKDLRCEKCQTWVLDNRRRVGVAIGCAALAFSLFCGPSKTTHDLPATVSIEELSREINGHIAPPDDDFGYDWSSKYDYGSYSRYR